MNIFFTSLCPVESANYLDNSRVSKMILESAQLLCGALHHYGENAPYKKTHFNHPMAVWCRESRSNYMWLWEHYVSLINVHFERRGTVHKSGDFKVYLRNMANLVPEKGLTKKPNCAGNDKLGISYKHMDDVYLAYQCYLADRWEHDIREPKWE